MVKIPNRLEDLYPASAIERILDVVNQQEIPEKVKNAISRVSSGEVNPLDQVQQAWQQARSWMDSLAGEIPAGEVAIVNASGMLIHEGLGSIPGTPAVPQLIARDCVHFLSERASVQRTEQSLDNLFGSNQATLAANVDAGLRALVRGRKVYIAKTDLVRIPHVGSLAAFLNASDVIEVGMANGASAEDWAAALRDVHDENRDMYCCLQVSPNATPGTGMKARPSSTMVEAASEKQIPCYGLWADAAVNEAIADAHGFPRLHSWAESGLNAVVAPLDVLMGAPAGSIVVGIESEVEKAKSALLDSGTQVAAGLRSALVIALQLGAAADTLESGALQGLVANPEALQERARRIAVQLDQNGVITAAKVTERKCPLGPAPWDRYAFNSYAIELESDEDLAAKFVEGWNTETGRVSVLAAVEGSKTLLDLRFVDPKDDHRIVEAFTKNSHEG